MRGRNPRPANLSRLAGDRRAIKKQTLEIPFAIPVSPHWLTPEAAAEWYEIVPVLARMRVIGEADQHAIALLADALSKWKHLTNEIKTHGYVHEVTDQNGNKKMVRSPHITMHIEYGQIVQKMLIQFGLTPSARGRITTDGNKEKKDNTFSRIDAEQA